MTLVNETCEAIHADGTPMAIHITLDAPAETQNSAGTVWTCDLILSPFFGLPQKISGESPLQTLTRATSLIRQTLSGFQSMGGKINSSNGENLGSVSDWLG